MKTPEKFIEERKTPEQKITEFETVDKRGNKVIDRFEYDNNGRITKISEPFVAFDNYGSGRKYEHDMETVTKFEYDENGNAVRIEKRDPYQEAIVNKEYDNRRLVVKEEREGWHKHSFVNDPTNHYHKTINYKYDDEKRLIEVDSKEYYHQNHSSEIFEYDKDGRLIKSRYSDNNYDYITYHEYDENGEPTKRVSMGIDDNGKEIPKSKKVSIFDTKEKVWSDFK